METEVVQKFNKALISMHDCKGGQVSKQTVVEITKAAINAVKYYKHIVFIIEKYLVKCRNDCKIPVLYVLDSILRQAKKQYLHKDVFAPRFAINIRNTMENILSCDHNDKLKVVRVINLWRVHKIFSDEIIGSLLQYCRATGLEVDEQKVEKLVKGEKANLKQYINVNSSFASFFKTNQDEEERSTTPQVPLDEGLLLHKTYSTITPPRQTGLITGAPPRTPPVPRPPTPILDKSFDEDSQQSFGISTKDTLILITSELPQLGASIYENQESIHRMQKFLNDRLQENLDIENRRQGNIKNILSRDFDYSDDDEDTQRNTTETSLKTLARDQIFSMAQALLSDSSIRKEIDEFLNIGGSKVSNSSDITPLSFDFSQPPPFLPCHIPAVVMATQNIPTEMIPKFNPCVPPPGFFPPSALGSMLPSITQKDVVHHPSKSNRETTLDRRERKRDRSRSHEDRDMRFNVSSSKRRERDRIDSRNGRRDRDRRESDQHRSRSGSSNIQQRDDFFKSRNAQDIDIEKERRRNGIPSKPKSDHVIIASRTLWFGRIPTTCYDSDIQEAIKDVALAEKISIVTPRGCAYVTMPDRRSAYKIMEKSTNLQVSKKTVKLNWAVFQGLKEFEDVRLMDYWESKRGFAEIPYSKLPDRLDLLLDGAWLDVETLPNQLKDFYDSKGSKFSQQQKHDSRSVQNIPTPAPESQLLFSTGTLPNTANASMYTSPASLLSQISLPQLGIPITDLNSSGLNSNSHIMVPSLTPFMPLLPRISSKAIDLTNANGLPVTPNHQNMLGRGYNNMPTYSDFSYRGNIRPKRPDFGRNWRGRGDSNRAWQSRLPFRGDYDRSFNSSQHQFFPPPNPSFKKRTAGADDEKYAHLDQMHCLGSDQFSESLVSTTQDELERIDNKPLIPFQDHEESLSEKEVTSTTASNDDLRREQLTEEPNNDDNLVPPGMEDY